jgi:hypothetical protein
MGTKGVLFISYSHQDMKQTHWLERLQLYLAPLRREEIVDVWDDSRIDVGSEWLSEIRETLERTSAAILLVGPGFLASKFILEEELPLLLEAARTRGVKIYPLVTGFCSYKQSMLEPYQAFNDPEGPLEALSAAEQNRILNDLSLLVDQDVRKSDTEVAAALPTPADTCTAIQWIKRHLSDTRTAFVAQARRRNDLAQMISDRLQVKEMLQYEKFFFRYYPKLNDEERFQFEMIRASTEGPLYEGNSKTLETIERHPAVMDEIPELAALRQHLVFWLNKYERVFSKRPEMCLLYAGVEDGVPFPRDIDKILDDYLKTHQ